MMNKNQILEQLEISREVFLEVLDGLDDADLIKPGVVGDWSIKDILSHLARWEAELVRLLYQALQGQKPTTTHFTVFDLDQSNAQWTKESQLRSLRQILDDFHAVRNQTILRTESFSEKDLVDPNRYGWAKGKPLSEWIASDSFDHEAEHLESIKAWIQAGNVSSK